MKLYGYVPACVGKKVTPRAGVWIETIVSVSVSRNSMSLPVRECGLKLLYCHMSVTSLSSLPVRECGLKQEEPLRNVQY